MSVPQNPHEWDITDIRPIHARGATDPDRWKAGARVMHARHGRFEIENIGGESYLLSFNMGTFNSAEEAAETADRFAQVLDMLGIKGVVRD